MTYAPHEQWSQKAAYGSQVENRTLHRSDGGGNALQGLIARHHASDRRKSNPFSWTNHVDVKNNIVTACNNSSSYTLVQVTLGYSYVVQVTGISKSLKNRAGKIPAGDRCVSIHPKVDIFQMNVKRNNCAVPRNFTDLYQPFQNFCANIYPLKIDRGYSGNVTPVPAQPYRLNFFEFSPPPLNYCTILYALGC